MPTCRVRTTLRERILYIVTTLGLPLRIPGSGAEFESTESAVDSELTLLYAKMRGAKFKTAGLFRNPFFGKKNAPFRHPDSPMYLVTRLAGYDFEDVKGIIDRSLQAGNRGKFVIDLKANNNEEGNDWLRAAARSLFMLAEWLSSQLFPLPSQRKPCVTISKARTEGGVSGPVLRMEMRRDCC